MGKAADPFAQQCLDEALCFAVGLRGAGPGEDVADVEKAQDIGAAARAAGAADIGHHPFGADTPSADPAQSLQQDAGSAQAVTIIQRDMHEALTSRPRKQGNRLKPIVGPGPGYARFLGGRIARLCAHLPRVAPRPPFPPLMMRAIGFGGGAVGATAAGGNECVKATRTLT